MAMWERQKEKEKGPSFSSSLLDAIYRSIDESNGAHRRNTATKVEDDIESLRRAIIIEKWIGNPTPRHIPSNSASSTDSSLFSSSETESPKSSLPKTKTKSRAHKIYGDFKKVKEPISPAAKISNFFNSIFSPRSTTRQYVDDEWTSMRKSRSMKDTTTTKSKRSVRFCDEFPKPAVGSQFIKKNIDSFRGKYDCYSEQRDLDDMSCASSDLFELENIGEELPVYETTTIPAARTRIC